MDERLLTETFIKIKKQYNAIQTVIETTKKSDTNDLSIQLYSNSDTGLNANKDNDNGLDQKQRMMMRMKHIERYIKFINTHMQNVSSIINDIPPYNVALEICDDNGKGKNGTTTDWDDITEQVYSTLKIESDDEDDVEEIHQEDFFDDDPPLRDEIASDTETVKEDILEEENCSEDDELEVSEIEIDKVKYYTTNEENGKIYHILANDKIGRNIGIFNKGVAEFY